MTEITYMTILWITALSGPLDGANYGIPYVTEEACKAAMVAVGDTLDYDHKMQCETLPVEKEMEP
jgi:hypothetical protein